MMIKKRAYPRAGLIGNPSDGYFGRTISFTFSNFFAEVTLYESPELELLPNRSDHSCFGSIRHLSENVNLYGYYGGLRLVKAAVRAFYEHCHAERISLHGRNFTLKYDSNIPHRVGLAGSSAIVTACMWAMMEFYEISIPKPMLANLILSVETEELGISAGLQDRVAQVYQGLVYMDFNQERMASLGYGDYIELDPAALPNLYIAYRDDLSEGSEVFHNDMRERFNRGEQDVLDAIQFWIELTEKARAAIDSGDVDGLGVLLNENFDRRADMYRISDGNLHMVEAARKQGASAKFTGSGGAIVGTYADQDMFEALRKEFSSMSIRLIKPKLISMSGDDHESA